MSIEMSSSNINSQQLKSFSNSVNYFSKQNSLFQLSFLYLILLECKNQSWQSSYGPARNVKGKLDRATELRASLGWFLFPKAELCVAKLRIASLPQRRQTRQGSCSAQAQLKKTSLQVLRELRSGTPCQPNSVNNISCTLFLKPNAHGNKQPFKYPMVVNNCCTSNCAGSHVSSVSIQI